MKQPGSESVYEAAARFAQSSLHGDRRSFVWPGQANVWTDANLQGFWQAFIDEAITSGGTFFERYKQQLGGQPDDLHRLAIDLLAFYYLFPDNITVGQKMARLQEV